MNIVDSRGVPVSENNRESLDQLEVATNLFHSYFGDPLGAIDRALEQAPEFIMGHCLRAGMLAMTSEKAVLPMMLTSVAALNRLRDRANSREQLHITALNEWMRGEFSSAVQWWGRVLDVFPRDSIALQLAHLGDFYLGQSNMLKERPERVLPHWDADVPGYGYVLGMYAFGLEEERRYAHAEDVGRRALEINSRDPWAVHAVAHVMEMQGRTKEGIEWLNGRRDDWAIDNGFAFHNWWHLALFHLELDEIDVALRLYDERIRAKPSQVAVEMVDASALLWRLKLRDVEAGQRWHELANAWSAFADDGHYAFNDVHAMMAFVADERKTLTERVTSAMNAATLGTGTNAAMTREVGLPVGRALEAFAMGDHEQVIKQLRDVVPFAQRSGGSHAQRDVLTLTLLESALRCGDAELARRLSLERSYAKPTSPLAHSLRVRAELLSGDVADLTRSASTDTATFS